MSADHPFVGEGDLCIKPVRVSATSGIYDYAEGVVPCNWPRSAHPPAQVVEAREVAAEDVCDVLHGDEAAAREWLRMAGFLVLLPPGLVDQHCRSLARFHASARSQGREAAVCDRPCCRERDPFGSDPL